MNNANLDKDGGHNRHRFGWVFEVAIVASVVPAIVYTIFSLAELPIA